MSNKQEKDFGVYRWDTFDNETIMIDEFDTISNAKKFIKEHYGDRLRSNGADKVDIVDLRGNVISSHKVG